MSNMSKVGPFPWCVGPQLTRGALCIYLMAVLIPYTELKGDVKVTDVLALKHNVHW